MKQKTPRPEPTPTPDDLPPFNPFEAGLYIGLVIGVLFVVGWVVVLKIVVGGW